MDNEVHGNDTMFLITGNRFLTLGGTFRKRDFSGRTDISTDERLADEDCVTKQQYTDSETLLY